MTDLSTLVSAVEAARQEYLAERRADTKPEADRMGFKERNAWQRYDELGRRLNAEATRAGWLKASR